MPGNVQPNAAPARKAAAHRPTCTHVEMIKVYGTNETCTVCRRLPSAGFIYSCDQSNDVYKGDASTSNVVSNPLRKLHLLRDAIRGNGSDTPLSLSQSVQRAIIGEEYTDQQVQILKQQKQLVRKTIDETLQRFQTIIAQGSRPHATKLEKRSGSHASTTSGLHISDASLRRSLEPCTFKVCHACRPLSRDRTFISFESVFKGDVKPPEEHDPWTMRVIDASIMKTIGNTKLDPDNPATRPFGSTTELEQAPEREFYILNSAPQRRPSVIFEAPEEEEISEGGLPVTPRLHKRSSSKDFRRSIRNSLQDMLKREMKDISEEQQDLLRARLQQVCDLCESHDDFEVELWRVMSDKVLSDAASVPLPPEGPMDFAKDSSVRLDFDASEQLINGGAALTEEALETGSPDLIISAV